MNEPKEKHINIYKCKSAYFETHYYYYYYYFMIILFFEFLCRVSAAIITKPQRSLETKFVCAVENEVRTWIVFLFILFFNGTLAGCAAVLCMYDDFHHRHRRCRSPVLRRMYIRFRNLAQQQYAGF